MAVKNSVAAIPMATFDTANLTANFQLMNTGLAQACFLLRFCNSSGVDVIISYDGATNHDLISANSVNTLPFQSNNQPQNNTALMAAKTKVWVKQRTAAGAGALTLSGYYQI